MKTNEEMNKFVSYLKGALIPDLEESGMEATAEDFETCCEMITDLISGEAAPDGLKPKVIVIVPNAWGKGDTLADAWSRAASHAGKTIAGAKRGEYLVYFGHDTEEVPLYLNEMGALCHHQDYPATLIDSKEKKS